MSNQIQASIGILAGGKNSRLNGLKKWNLKINDLSLIERSIKISKCFKKQYIVGKKELEIKDVQFLKDKFEYSSPIIGLHSLLKSSKYKWNFLLACDLPFITDKIFRLIWNKKNENKLAIIPYSKDNIHYTCGYYNKKLLFQIEKNIKIGKLSLKNLLSDEDIILVKSNKEDFFNLNSFDDLKKFEEKLNII
tara:strand:- start:10509 stop:11084 length:576 start_codon:yes stop_codon:yes gene_type:complete